MECVKSCFREILASPFSNGIINALYPFLCFFFARCLKLNNLGIYKSKSNTYHVYSMYCRAFFEGYKFHEKSKTLFSWKLFLRINISSPGHHLYDYD